MTPTPAELPPIPTAFVPQPRSIAWMTWLLISSTVFVFVLQLIVLHFFGEDVLGDALAFSPDALAAGHYWTVLTYAWAHAVAIFGSPSLFWLHIVSNMIFLWCLGPDLEERLGPFRFLGLYLGGAIVAALVWLAFNPQAEEGIIGASGAVFALVGAIGAAAPRQRITVYFFYVLPLRMSFGLLAVAICGVEAVQAAFGWMPEVAHSAHLGGAAFGVAYILAMKILSRFTR